MVCFRCQQETEVKVIPSLGNNFYCKECYIDAMMENQALEIRVMTIEDFMHSLVSNPCNKATCIGCHPENFNEKGEFQKEKLH